MVDFKTTAKDELRLAISAVWRQRDGVQVLGDLAECLGQMQGTLESNATITPRESQQLIVTRIAKGNRDAKLRLSQSAGT